MKAAFLIFLFPAFAHASNQNITCYGTEQQGTLYLEFGVRPSASAEINDEGKTYSADLKVRVENAADGTVTYKQKRGSIRVTIPKIWEDHGFDRFSKHQKNGYQITEMTKFEFGKGQSLAITECESSVD